MPFMTLCHVITTSNYHANKTRYSAALCFDRGLNFKKYANIKCIIAGRSFFCLADCMG